MYNNTLLKVKELRKELDTMPGVMLNNDTVLSDVDLFNNFVNDKQLKKAVEKLFRDGHHARAVEEAYKFIDNLVKKMAKPADVGLSGSKLMITAFNVTNPLLRVNAGETASERDEQNGYMQILSGCMTGIRNPRAHESDWEDNEIKALQLLIWANHLVERIRLSEKVEMTKQSPN
jgi:TIGR02391 family protein